jgi:hypothetical protein
MLTNARHPEMPYSQIGQVTNFALKMSENSEGALNVASQGTEMALFGPFRPLFGQFLYGVLRSSPPKVTS